MGQADFRNTHRHQVGTPKARNLALSTWSLVMVVSGPHQKAAQLKQVFS